jgi:enoyl-CoA hydratase
MGERTTYRLDDGIATITMDDGKVNVLSSQMLAELKVALDQAASDHAVVLLTGRPGIFTAGFNLPELQAGGPHAQSMLTAGFELAEQLLSFPTPVVIACPGHAIAMGVFLLLSGDYRLGTAGSFKIVANEVAINMTMPRTAIEICRQRLAPAHFVRAVTLAEVYSPEAAVAAGFLDEVVEADRLAAAALEVATRLATLSPEAHTATKLRLKHKTLLAIREAMEADADTTGDAGSA